MAKASMNKNLGVSITCPQGLGETDRGRCVDRAACLLPPLVCMLCPIPPALIAQGGRNNINRHLAAKLTGLISSPWTPPANVIRRLRASKTLGTISRGLALARAVARYLERAPQADSIPLRKLLPIHNAVPNAIDAQDAKALATMLRRQGLPVEKRRGRPFLVVSDHVRAFVRAHKEAA